MRLSAITTGVGLGGLLIGLLLFPHSNLLGGLALIFGASLLDRPARPVGVRVGWAIATLARLRRKNR